MRVLIVNQYFGDDQTPTGRMAFDVAQALCERGHDVVALAGKSSYITTRDIDASLLLGTGPAHGIEVHRLPLLNGGRIPRWGSYWAQVAARVNGLTWDCALLLTDPPFLPTAARLFRRTDRPIYWWTMDLYPEALAARGDLRADSAPYRALTRLNEYGLEAVDGVIALGSRQLQRLRRYGNCPPDDRCVVVPPWDLRRIPFVPRRSNRFLQQQGWMDKKVALYAGNLGEAHGFDELLEGARILEDWVFAFVTRGARKRALVEAAADVPNVHVMDYVEPAMTADLLWAADVHLITMNPGWEGVVVPSKLYGALATRAPVLFVGPEAADTAVEIERCRAGLTLPSGCGGLAVASAIKQLEGRKVFVRPHEDGPHLVAEFVLHGKHELQGARREMSLAA